VNVAFLALLELDESADRGLLVEIRRNRVFFN